MKSSRSSLHSYRSGSSTSGVVLVTVLIVLVLLVVLVVAFLSRVTSERTSATGFHGSASARALADMAVGLVQGQIDLATAQGPTNVWCSQPGMVRTYDSSGNFYNAFKLYSANNMIATAATGFSITGDVPPTTWSTDRAFWADLNSPVQTPSGTNVYPIVNPSATNAATGVSGFSITAPPGATTGQPLPMPVRWLYVLENGSLVAPTGSGSTATVAGETPTNKIVGRIAFWTDDNTCRVNINTASAGTFWDVPRGYTTNAASGVPTPGSPSQEQALGYYQPVQHEFQRYPGHPAMTDLRAVFTNATPAQIYNIVPRIVGGGSTQGTVVVSAGSTLTGYPKTAPGSRLYANVDELLFQGDHKTPSTPVNTTSTTITPVQLEASKFFLTAQSRAPEVDLFGLPRVACWPINADYDPVNNPSSPYTTAFDRLIAFCSSSGPAATSAAYYFTRQNNLSPYDINLANANGVQRNLQLYQYLQYLTSQAIPGFGTTTFLTKYPAPTGLPSDRDQILTEIYDYIRCTNLYDDTLDQSAGQNKYEFTGKGFTATGASGYVVPTLNGTTSSASPTAVPMGFGRYNTISQLGIGFICNADGNLVGGQPNPSNIPEADITKTAFYAPNKGGNRVLGGVPLAAGNKYIQAILIPEFYSVMHGFVSMYPNVQLTVSGLSTLQINGKQLFPNDTEGPISYHDLRADGAYPPATGGFGPDFGTGVASIYGANPGWRYFGLGMNLVSNSQGRGRIIPARGNIPADKTGASDLYPLVGTPIIITDTAQTMAFTSSGDLKLTVSVKDPVSGTINTIQTISINLPSATFPTPKIVTNLTTTDTVSPYNNLHCATVSNGTEVPTSQETWWGFNATGVISDGYIPGMGAGTVTTNLGTTLNTFGRMTYIAQPPSSTSGTPYAGVFLLPNFDVLRTVFPQHGDYRLVAGRNVVPDTVFLPHRYYSDTTQMFASDLSNSANTGFDPGYDTGGKYISTITSAAGHEPPISPLSTSTPEATGDYDDSLPDLFPGPLINKPNEGAVMKTGTAGSIPYYANVVQTGANGLGGIDINLDGGAFFSPNRMMPSPGMLGSLPSGVMAGKPWQTLLFRPQVGHPGAVSPPDHLLLDLFWMPVVEPYAISDRFSTAGKINMNYQILPFTYLSRSTGLYALFQSEKVTAIANTEIAKYKIPPILGGGSKVPFRFSIDATATLSQFDTKFSAGDVFKSASEICSIHIVPDGGSSGLTPGVNTVAGMPAYWASHALTGDNDRERIYTTLYPRLTTKSNTYTVFFVAQSLNKTTASTYGTWTEGTDVVQGEYRGSAVIERFIDANNTSIPDYAADAASGRISNDATLDNYYRWRVISNRQFTP